MAKLALLAFTLAEFMKFSKAVAAALLIELLVAVPPRRFDELAAVAARLNLTFTAIGELRRGTGVTWALEGLSFAAPARGYEHFR